LIIFSSAEYCLTSFCESKTAEAIISVYGSWCSHTRLKAGLILIVLLAISSLLLSDSFHTVEFKVFIQITDNLFLDVWKNKITCHTWSQNVVYKYWNFWKNGSKLSPRRKQNRYFFGATTYNSLRFCPYVSKPKSFQVVKLIYSLLVSNLEEARLLQVVTVQNLAWNYYRKLACL